VGWAGAGRSLFVTRCADIARYVCAFASAVGRVGARFARGFYGPRERRPFRFGVGAERWRESPAKRRYGRRTGSVSVLHPTLRKRREGWRTRLVHKSKLRLHRYLQSTRVELCSAG